MNVIILGVWVVRIWISQSPVTWGNWLQYWPTCVS